MMSQTESAALEPALPPDKATLLLKRTPSMLRFLDPRFRLVAALIDDPSETTSMRETALTHAKIIAAQCGYAFDEALAKVGLPMQSADIEDAEPASVHAYADDQEGDVSGAETRSDPPDGDESNGEATLTTAGPLRLADDKAPAGEHEEAAEPSVISSDMGEGSTLPTDGEVSYASGGQIAAALHADPSRSNRDIAREFGASPTTVGKTRLALGLVKAVRSVTRRGKPYEMTVGDRS